MQSITRFLLSSATFSVAVAQVVGAQEVLGERATAVNPAKPPTVPGFVEEYAPIIYLHSQESYFPSSLQTHLDNVIPYLNTTRVLTSSFDKKLTLSDLDELNKLGKHDGTDVFLTAKHNVAVLPGGDAQEWLYGEKPDRKGKSKAAIPVVIAPKERGVVDAFWLTFYSYNQGQTALGFSEFGDHVGDWEHVMVRFKDGKPQALWVSQHGKGQAFAYAAVEKKGKRPIVYSAKGSHALYATQSVQVAAPQVILSLNLSPFIPDYTDNGTLWDPLLTSPLYYTLSTKSSSNKPSNVFTPTHPNTLPANWLYFNGQWGDKTYPADTPGQVNLAGIIQKFTDGPTGPNAGADKDLSRGEVCPGNVVPCNVTDMLPKSIGFVEHLLGFEGCKNVAG